jgi:hypothetical protein
VLWQTSTATLTTSENVGNDHIAAVESLQLLHTCRFGRNTCPQCSGMRQTHDGRRSASLH